ncbi:alpha/beta fold hydrolase [Novosphingobium sp.]|uniref:alpha/beta fold hydrolase n=1 Tax=Novosphingobium sp. TaxID=1874826 RepID=UPI003D1353B3
MTSQTKSRPNACTAAFTDVGVAGRRLRIGQWHADPGGTAPGMPPLVILGGIGMNIEMLEPLAHRMPRRHLISVDMPGIGKSPDPIFPYTMAQIALTLASLFDRMQIDQVDVLGISWGGAVAQQFAFQHRARIRRLILASTSSGNVMMPAGAAMMNHLFDPKEYTVEAALRRNLAMVYNGGGAGQVSLNAATAPSPLGYTYQVAAFAGWTSAGFLPLLSLPVLVMADNEDQFIPVSNAHFLHNAIPGSRIELSDGGGHLFMLTQPERFAQAVGDFLD